MQTFSPNIEGPLSRLAIQSVLKAVSTRVDNDCVMRCAARYFILAELAIVRVSCLMKWLQL